MLNRLITIFICFLFVLIFSCASRQPETPEALVTRLTTYLKNEDNAALFDVMMHRESDIIKFMTQIQKRSFREKTDIEQTAKEMSQAAHEDEQRIVRAFSRGSIHDWNGLQIDSVTSSDPWINENRNNALPKGYRAAEVTAYYSRGDEKYVVQMPCVDLNTGQWQIIGYPKIN
jgi:hypothetical protein